MRVYGHDPEDILHIIRYCTLAKEVWNQVISRTQQFNFFSIPLFEWMSFNLQVTSTPRHGEIIWAWLFKILVWRLWKNRNLFVFQGKSCSAIEIVKSSTCWAKQFSSSYREVAGLELEATNGECLTRGWLVLNTNGAIQVDLGNVATGECRGMKMKSGSRATTNILVTA